MARIGAVLPAGVGEDGQVRVGNAMVAADLMDWIGGSISRVELESVEGASLKVNNEQDEGTEVDIARADTCFCKFSNSK